MDHRPVGVSDGPPPILPVADDYAVASMASRSRKG
jgi:hypothetical protein